MQTIPTAAAGIQAHPAPVVFLDTCALLDVVRAPNRDAATTVEAAIRLLAGVKRNPPTVHLVIGCPTPIEWHDHVDEAAAECTVAVVGVNSVAQTWGCLGVAGIPLLPFHALPLPDRLKDLSRELLDAAILLDKDFEALSRAVDRVISAKLPAKRGGKGAKDSVILEHAIGLTRTLRIAGFNQICVFVSSNTDDFAKSGTTMLHPLLKPDFDPPTNLQYAVNLSRTVSILKADGWSP